MEWTRRREEDNPQWPMANGLEMEEWNGLDGLIEGGTVTTAQLHHHDRTFAQFNTCVLIGKPSLCALRSSKPSTSNPIHSLGKQPQQR